MKTARIEWRIQPKFQRPYQLDSDCKWTSFAELPADQAAGFVRSLNRKASDGGKAGSHVFEYRIKDYS